MRTWNQRLAERTGIYAGFALILGASLSPAWSGVPTGESFLEVRLDSPGGSMEHAPVHSQIGGTCYAYAAGLAIDTWRAQFEPSQTFRRINPFELALGHGQLEYGQFRWDGTVDGGSFCATIHYAERAGICTLDTFPLVDDDGDRLKKLLKDIEALRVRFKKIPFWRRKKPEALAIATQIRTRLSEFTHYRDGSTPLPDTDTILRALHLRKRDFARTLVSDPRCKDHRNHDFLLPGRCHTDLTHFEPEDKIIRRLEEGLFAPFSQPLAIAYCSKVLKEGKNYSGFSHDLRDFRFVNSTECGGHVSLISGKRIHPTGGQLQFLIHNSWGTGCDYSADWQCENGKIWVDADALARNTYGVMQLE